MPDADELTEAVERRALSIEPLRIIYAGRLEQTQKRILDYVAVVKQLSESGIPFRLTIVGEGLRSGVDGAKHPDQQRLEMELSPFIRAGTVEMLGRVPEDKVPGILRQHHVFLLLSEYEGLPVSVIEAMANGCVPVVSRIDSGVSELIEPGTNGLIFEPRDWKELASALDRLRRDRARWEQLARAAIATPAQQGLTVETMGERYGALIEEIFTELRERRYHRPAPLTTVDPEAIAPPSLASVYRIP